MLVFVGLPSAEDCKTGFADYHPRGVNGVEKILPPIDAKNARSAYLHGVLLTDTIAQWVKNKMVAGPFDKPPLKNFRVKTPDGSSTEEQNPPNFELVRPETFLV